MRLGLIYGKTSILGSDVDFFIDKILKFKSRGIDVIVCPEFALTGKHPYSEEESKAILSRIEKGGNLQKKLILPGTYLLKKGDYMFNVLPMFVNGKISFYHKKTVNDEKTIAKKYGLKYMSGGGDNARFMFGRRVVGVEICRDNPMGKLKKEGYVNLQILVDSGSQYPKPTALSRGGYFVICSGFSSGWDKPYTQIMDSNKRILTHKEGSGVLEYEIK